MLFDPRAAKLLPPGEHILIQGCNGLRLVASESRKSWIYRYKDAAGSMRQTRLGQWPAMPVQEAVAAWQALTKAREAGQDPKALNKRKAPPAPAGYTARQAVLDYLDGHVDHARKPDGAAAARKALEALLDAEPAFAASQAEALTRGIAFDLLDARKATPTATQKLRSMLGGAWDYALDRGKIGGETPNWWRTVHRGRLVSKGKIVGGKHEGRKRRVLSEPEVGQLLSWLPNMHEIGRDITVLYLWTGTRGSEICSLRPQHVREEATGWWWTVPKELTKNAGNEFAVDHRVPLFGRALEVVQRRLASVGKSGALFEDAKGDPYNQKAYGTYIYDLQPYSSKAKAMEGRRMTLSVTGWTAHNLRRTARTLLASIGCLKEYAEAIIGHLPEDIEATYNAYTYDKERLHWLAALDQKLEQIASAHAEGLPVRP